MLVLVHDENIMQGPFVILGDTIKRTTFYLHQYYDKKNQVPNEQAETFTTLKM